MINGDVEPVTVMVEVMVTVGTHNKPVREEYSRLIHGLC